jgi:hypothetical protein
MYIKLIAVSGEKQNFGILTNAKQLKIEKPHE